MKERNQKMATDLRKLIGDTEPIKQRTWFVQTVLEQGVKELPTIPKKEKDYAFSDKTKGLLKQRKTHWQKTT